MEYRQPNIVRLGPRIAVPAAEAEEVGVMESIMSIAVPDRVVEPRSAATTTASSSDSSSTCTANNNSAECQKPVSGSTFTLPIILGVA